MNDDRTILAVPGLSTTSQEFRAGLWEMAARNGWPVDAIAAVISSESGFNPAAKNPQPGQTASGLIQFIDSTARGLGIDGGAEAVRAMTAEQQLPWIEKFYRRAFNGRTPRPVDFYLAGWGSGIGQPDGYVLAEDPDKLYVLNRSLDANADGTIAVADIRAKLERQQAKAGGKRLDATTPATLGNLLAAAAPALLSFFLIGAVLQIRRKP